MKNLFWLSVLYFSVLINVSFSCTRFELDVPIQAEFTRADSVFIGKAVEVEDLSGKDDNPNNWLKVQFKVQQNFKGAENPTFTIVTSDWRAACDLKIKKGQTWIIYARYDDKDKVFRSIIGNKYNSSEDKEEVEILKLASARKTDNAISGRLTSFMYMPYQHQAAEITVEGNGIQRTTSTKPDGTFSVTPLTTGNYKVKMKFPFDASILYYPKSDLKPLYSEGIPTLFDYEVKLKQGDYDYRTFEVFKIW
jgi:hypothetical protein